MCYGLVCNKIVCLGFGPETEEVIKNILEHMSRSDVKGWIKAEYLPLRGHDCWIT